MFSVDPSQLDAAASKLDGIAGAIRGLKLDSKMSVLGDAMPDTPNCTSAIKKAADTADATVTTSLSHCSGQVEAFGALVREARKVTETTDDENSRWFTDAGKLPTVRPWDPSNTRPSGGH